MIDWFKKKNVAKMGILMFAILSGMTSQSSIDSGTYWYAIIVALCGLGFAYDV